MIKRAALLVRPESYGSEETGSAHLAGRHDMTRPVFFNSSTIGMRAMSGGRLRRSPLSWFLGCSVLVRVRVGCTFLYSACPSTSTGIHVHVGEQRVFIQRCLKF